MTCSPSTSASGATAVRGSFGVATSSRDPEPGGVRLGGGTRRSSATTPSAAVPRPASRWSLTAMCQVERRAACIAADAALQAVPMLGLAREDQGDPPSGTC